MSVKQVRLSSVVCVLCGRHVPHEGRGAALWDGGFAHAECVQTRRDLEETFDFERRARVGPVTSEEITENRARHVRLLKAAKARGTCWRCERPAVLARRDGSTLAWCGHCMRPAWDGHSAGGRGLVGPPSELPPRAWRSAGVCERCGGFEEVETHHWAPQSMFSDSFRWPTSSLCRRCHMEWHRVVTPALAAGK
mgnify:CR=1 FL=1